MYILTDGATFWSHTVGTIGKTIYFNVHPFPTHAKQVIEMAVKAFAEHIRAGETND